MPDTRTKHQGAEGLISIEITPAAGMTPSVREDLYVFNYSFKETRTTKPSTTTGDFDATDQTVYGDKLETGREGVLEFSVHRTDEIDLHTQFRKKKVINNVIFKEFTPLTTGSPPDQGMSFTSVGVEDISMNPGGVDDIQSWTITCFTKGKYFDGTLFGM